VFVRVKYCDFSALQIEFLNVIWSNGYVLFAMSTKVTSGPKSPNESLQILTALEVNSELKQTRWFNL
jgi:hypothetical protein